MKPEHPADVVQEAGPPVPQPDVPWYRKRRGCLRFALIGLGILVVVSILQPMLPLLAIWYLIFLPENLAQPTVDLPEIRGRIVELQTGAPIAGVHITREATQWTVPDLESHNSAPVEQAKSTTWTNGDGRFAFHRVWRVRGLQTMSWTLYKEGWMPSGATVTWDRATRSFDCSGGDTADAWHRFTCRQLPWEGDLELEIRISRPTYDGVKIPIYSMAEGKRVLLDPDPAKHHDAWSEYFDRLISRADRGELSGIDVAEQLCRHIAAGGRLGEPAISDLGRVSGWISNSDPEVASKRALLAAATHEFCLEHPSHALCERRGFGQDRASTAHARPAARSDPQSTAVAGTGPTTAPTKSPGEQAGGSTDQGSRAVIERSFQSTRLLGKYSESDAWELPAIGALGVRGSHAVHLVTDRMGRRCETAAASLGFDAARIAGVTRTVVVPSGALWQRGDEPGVREPLQDFVERGGGLIVFGQALTEDYRAVPVPPGESLHAIGYDHNIAPATGLYVAARHPITSCLTSPTFDVARGGYIESWPTDAQVLLRKTEGGPAAGVVYRVGKGAVFVFCTWEDQEWREKAAPEDVVAFVANLIAWADDPNRPRPTCRAGKPCRAEFRRPLRNRTGTPAVAVELRLWDPVAPDAVAHRWQQPLQLAPGAATELVARLDLPPGVRLRPGIHQLSARILGAPPQISGATEQLPPIVIQLEPDFGQITVEGGLEIATRAPDVGVGTAGFGRAGALFNDLPIRVSLRNFSQAAFTGRVVLYGTNRTGATRKPIAEWPVTLAPAAAAENRDLTLGTFWENGIEPAVMWLNVDLIDEAGKKVLTAKNYLSKRAWEN